MLRVRDLVGGHEGLNALLGLTLRHLNCADDLFVLLHAIDNETRLLQHLQISLTFLALITHELHTLLQIGGKVALLLFLRR